MDKKSKPNEIYIAKLDNHASYQEQEDSKDSNENKAQWEDGTITTQLLNIAKTYEIVEFEVPIEYGR
jgi:hypothetical protein